jgi:hypothetical protein
MEVYAAVFAGLVSGAFAPLDAVFEQLFLAATSLILVGAVGVVIFPRVGVAFAKTSSDSVDDGRCSRDRLRNV